MVYLFPFKFLIGMSAIYASSPTPIPLTAEDIGAEAGVLAGISESCKFNFGARLKAEWETFLNEAPQKDVSLKEAATRSYQKNYERIMSQKAENNLEIKKQCALPESAYSSGVRSIQRLIGFYRWPNRENSKL